MADPIVPVPPKMPENLTSDLKILEKWVKEASEWMHHLYEKAKAFVETEVDDVEG